MLRYGPRVVRGNRNHTFDVDGTWKRTVSARQDRDDEPYARKSIYETAYTEDADDPRLTAGTSHA
jgi:hypothetical protein